MLDLDLGFFLSLEILPKFGLCIRVIANHAEWASRTGAFITLFVGFLNDAECKELIAFDLKSLWLTTSCDIIFCRGYACQGLAAPKLQRLFLQNNFVGTLKRLPRCASHGWETVFLGMWNAARKNFPNVPDLAILQIDIALSDIAFLQVSFARVQGRQQNMENLRDEMFIEKLNDSRQCAWGSIFIHQFQFWCSLFLVVCMCSRMYLYKFTSYADNKQWEFPCSKPCSKKSTAKFSRLCLYRCT